jgi:tetratricopeptide (TPR) repeat protein
LFPNIGKIWRSSIVDVYQKEHYWEAADQLILEDTGPVLQQILDGKPCPNYEKGKHELPLSQARLIYIRKGESANVIRLSEFLSKQRPDNPYESVTLGCVYMDYGRYDDGFRVLNQTRVQLETAGREDSPPYLSVHLGMTSGYISLHKIKEAQATLSKLEEIVNVLAGGNQKDRIDQLVVKHNVLKHEMHRAQCLKLSGRIQKFTGNPEASLTLTAAREIMKNKELQKTLTLLYPDIVNQLADLALMQKQFDKAAQFAKEADEYYENETRYKGRDYHNNKAILVYARFKQGKIGNYSDELNQCLTELRNLCAEAHPYIADCLVRLGEVYLSEHKPSEARQAFEQALTISQKLFRPDDRQINDIETKLSSMAVAQ